MVSGDAPAIGAELSTHSAVRKITFTGSTRVGKLLMKQAADTVKRVSMELGGNAPYIVFKDADVQKAAEAAVGSGLRNAGQTCICANRIFVEVRVFWHAAFQGDLAPSGFRGGCRGARDWQWLLGDRQWLLGDWQWLLGDLWGFVFMLSLALGSPNMFKRSQRLKRISAGLIQKYQ